MAKFQNTGVQKVATEPEGFRIRVAVDRIAHDRMADGRQVDADLMRHTRFHINR